MTSDLDIWHGGSTLFHLGSFNIKCHRSKFMVTGESVILGYEFSQTDRKVKVKLRKTILMVNVTVPMSVCLCTQINAVVLTACLSSSSYRSGQCNLK